MTTKDTTQAAAKMGRENHQLTNTTQAAETYRLMIAENVKELSDLDSLEGILAYTQILLQNIGEHERK